MPEICIVRKPIELTEAELAGARKFLFSMLHGHTDDDRSNWNSLIGMLWRMAPGEMLTVHTTAQRHANYSRMHMKLEDMVFKAQDTFTDFRAGFRDWLKIGAGHCDWVPAEGGHLTPRPKSTSYDSMEEGEMRQFHRHTLQFLRSERAACTLWPNMPAMKAMAMMNDVLRRFEEWPR